MRTIITIILITVASAYFLSGCTVTECERIQQKELVLLMDATDNTLLERINAELASNFQGFMQQSGLGTISTCEGLTLRLAPITSNSMLDLTSESIAVAKKMQSNRWENRHSDPEPLVKLIRQKQKDYSKISRNPDLTTESHVVNTLLKAINASNLEADQSTIIIFSDLIENSMFLNMYRGIPSESQRSESIQKLLDPLEMQKFRELHRQGLDPEIIVVTMPTFGSAEFQRELRSFWWYLLNEELGLQNIKFIDNLSQYRRDLP